MYRLLFLLLTLSLCWSCQREVEEVKEIEIVKEIDADAEPGLIHTVYFWLKEEVDTAAAKEFEEGVWTLEGIPTVKRMFMGPPATTPTRGVTDNSFDYALILWFDDVAGHDAYQIHKIHTDFVAAQEDKFARVQVYDNVLSR
ncbi:MAG: Dabb family protein [Bacteroidota bacterium]